MQTSQFKTTMLCILMLFSLKVFATDINFSGYGSIRGGIETDDDSASPSFGYDDNVDFKNESLFAIQAKANLNDFWSATLVMRAAGDEDYDIEARWAYLNYQIQPETVITFGRFALPYFRHSDTQDIGYSHNYTRMPISIYAGQEFDIIEGIRVAHSTFLGDGDLTLKGSLGAFDGEVAVLGQQRDIDINNIIQFSAEYSYEWFSAYAGVVSAETTLDINSALGQQLIYTLTGYRVDGDQVFSPVTNSYVYNMQDAYVDEDDSLYYSAGITAEYESWIFNLEYAAYDIDDSLFEENEAYYAAVSYNFGDITLSFVHEDVSYSFDYEHANSTDPNVNAFLIGSTDALFKDDEYDAQGIHLRYEAHLGIAYKLEYTQTNHDLSGDDNSVVVAGIDFVF
ncbi:porin [Catenovulum sp. SM1970]|uniref:porin n=1 Tax=Marinifaba aquimaris TaxID=2741323 RepID=UPI0015749259|nr:porin [Marinifaba aquimaris]NTS78364.1 porin [Marinifaba aquimaris]